MDGPGESRHPNPDEPGVETEPGVEIVPTGPEPEQDVAAGVLLPGTGELQSEALRASWWTALQAVITVPLSVVVNLVVARALGPVDYGTVASYTAAFSILMVVLNAGISDATIQWGAAAHARGDRVELLAIGRRCAGFHLLVQTPLGAAMTVAVLRNESVLVQAIGAVAVALILATGTAAVLLTAMSMNTIMAKLNLVVGTALQLGVVTAALASHAAGPTWVARLALTLLVPVGLLFVTPADVRRACFRPLLPRGWPPGFARFAARSLIAGLVTTLVFSRSEVLVLDAYGQDAAAGLFALAAGLAVQITAPVDAALGPLVPAAASLVEIGRERAGAAVLRGLRLGVLATAPLALVVVPVVATLTAFVYGADFESAGRLFVALGLVSCVQSVLHPVTAFVTALRRPLLVLAVNGAALVLDLGLVFALVPSLGATGAVIGNTAGQAFSLAASVWLLRRHLDLGARATATALAPFALVLVASGAGSAFGLVLHADGSALGAAAGAAVVTSVVLGYVTLRLIGGVVTSGDVRTLTDTFGRAAPALALCGRLGLVRHDQV